MEGVAMKMNLKKAVVRRLRRLTPIKTNLYLATLAHLSGDALSAINSLKICVNLRNLRIKLRFLALTVFKAKIRYTP